MKFFKHIGHHPERHGDFRYLDYKALKKKIKEAAKYIEDTSGAFEHGIIRIRCLRAAAISFNQDFEQLLSAEIDQVNACRGEHVLRRRE